MRRSASLVALLLLLLGSQPASARIAGPSVGAPSPGAGRPLSREALLVLATGFNLAGSSVVAVELTTGKKQLALSAASLLLTAPAAVYLTNEVRRDPDDALMIGAAVWSAALVTRSVIDLIRNHDPNSELSNRRMIIQPMFDPGTGGAKPSIGVDLSGKF